MVLIVIKSNTLNKYRYTNLSKFGENHKVWTVHLCFNVDVMQIT